MMTLFRLFSRKHFAFLFLLFYCNSCAKRAAFSYGRRRMFLVVVCVCYVSIKSLSPVMAVNVTTNPPPPTTLAQFTIAMPLTTSRDDVDRVPIGTVPKNLQNNPRSRQQQHPPPTGLLSTNFQHLDSEDDYFEDDEDDMDDEQKQIEQLKKNGTGTHELSGSLKIDMQSCLLCNEPVCNYLSTMRISLCESTGIL